jgi:hypothetical protein
MMVRWKYGNTNCFYVLETLWRLLGPRRPYFRHYYTVASIRGKGSLQTRARGCLPPTPTR